MDHQYDDPVFFEQYAGMARSREGLSAAGEWRPRRRRLAPHPPPSLFKH